MTAGMTLTIFEDFNDLRDEPIPPPAEDLPPADETLVRIREEAWIDGYMTARRGEPGQFHDRTLTARLLTSVHELDAKITGAVEAAALTVADLLINTVIAATSDEWQARLLDRVRTVVDQIRPALTIAPEFVLHEAGGAMRHFADISELSRALDDADVNQDVSIRWQRGEATISCKAILGDLREAMIPLSAGLNNEHFTRQHS